MDHAVHSSSGAPASQITLSISLFGPMVVRIGDSALPPPRSNRGKWLLALLALRRDTDVDRRWLAGTLWPESDDTLSLANLRRTLTDLRTRLGSEGVRIVSSTRTTLRFESHGCSLDLAEFNAGIKLGSETALLRCVELHCGPLLEGCFEDWILLDREVCSQKYLDSLETLAAFSAARGEYGAAANYLKRVITAEPLRECAQRSLIKMLAACGDYSAALQIYRDLRLLLRRQLNTEPDPETRHVFEEMQASIRQEPKPRDTPDVASIRSLDAESRNPVPFPISTIIGRDRELIEIGKRLRQARILTLTGAGGVGKTRLAIEAANQFAPLYADGAAFVELASINDSVSVIGAFAAALGIRESSGQAMLSSICKALTYCQILIVVDNCEHLLSAAAEVAEALLIRCPNVRVIATSRQPLGIPGEQDFHVAPLALPPEPANLQNGPISLEETIRYDAVRLFMERSAAGVGQHTLTVDDVASIAAICRRLDGIPLALELAAARTRHFELHEIEARLKKALPLLKGVGGTAAPRQQALTAALDWSFDLLNAEERQLLTRLSVFAGPFDLHAASQICIGSASENAEPSLHMLVDKSLVSRVPVGTRTRYGLLQITREYLSDKLRESGELEETARRHADYFLALAADIPNAWKSDPAQALQLIDDNERELLAVLDWCIHSSYAESYSDRVLSMARMLAVHCGNRGSWVSAQRWIDDLLCRLNVRTEPRANALLRSAALAVTRDDFGTAQVCAEEALSIFRELNEPVGIARSLNLLGKSAACTANPAAAFAYLDEAMEIYRSFGPETGSVSVHTNLGFAFYAMGEYRRSIEEHELCLKIGEEQGSAIGRAWAMDNLGDASLAAGEVEQAQRYYNQALPIFVAIRHFVGVSECVRGLAQATVTMRRTGYYPAAAALMGAAETLRFGAEPIMPMLREDYEKSVEQLRINLGQLDFDIHWRRGRSMAMQSVLDEATGIA